MRNLLLIFIYVLKYTLLAIISLGFAILLVILFPFSVFIKSEDIRFEIERMNRILKSIIEV